MAELVSERVGDVVIACHSANPPTDEEWGTLLEEMESSLEQLSGILVFTAGASINATQREQIQLLFKKGGLRAAVLTDSRLVRGAVTALGWFGIPIRAFDHPKVDEAIASLEPSDPEGVKQKLGELRARVS